MRTRSKVLLTGVIGAVAAAATLALTVSPFDYGVVKSAALAASFVLVALYRTVLDDTFASS